MIANITINNIVINSNVPFWFQVFTGIIVLAVTGVIVYALVRK